MVEVVRTNFAPIFSDFENFLGHSGTNRSATYRRFSNLLYKLERYFLPRKNDANPVKIGLERKTLSLVVIHYVTDTIEFRKRDTTRKMAFANKTCVSGKN